MTRVDIKAFVLPNAASLNIALIGLFRQGSTAATALPYLLLVTVCLGLVLGIFSHLYWRRHGSEALGLGDVKLIMAGTLVVGLSGLWLMIFLASFGGIAVSLLSRDRRDGIPFGPFLGYSIILTVILQGPL